MDIALIVTFAGIVIAGLAGILGIWMEDRAPGASLRPAKVFTLMLVIACGVEIAHTRTVASHQAETEQRLATVLEAMAHLAGMGGNPALDKFVGSELSVQARANPKLIAKVEKAAASKGRDGKAIRTRVTEGRRQAAGLSKKKPAEGKKPKLAGAKGKNAAGAKGKGKGKGKGKNAAGARGKGKNAAGAKGKGKGKGKNAAGAKGKGKNAGAKGKGKNAGAKGKGKGGGSKSGGASSKAANAAKNAATGGGSSKGSGSGKSGSSAKSKAANAAKNATSGGKKKKKKR